MMRCGTFSSSWFQFVHRSNLVYNTCWEDPRLDREALRLGPDDNVLVITSAGCNVLDYALDSPAHIYAVDLNPRQNWLLELKLAAIRSLEFSEFFAMFGRGRLPGVADVYRARLRPHLKVPARIYWDRHIGFFSERSPRDSFYFRGTAGRFARFVNHYLDRFARVRDALDSILAARTIEEQREIYERHLRRRVWSRFIRWLMERNVTLSMLGVPPPQRRQVERDYAGGIARFVQDSVEAVFTRLPLSDNYFWRVYLTGEYLPTCCPEYLKPENFERLRGGLVDRISTHTSSILDFLREHDGRISRFVLLDHMDWLAAYRLDVLAAEWQAILDRAAPDTRILWRSGGLRTDFIEQIDVRSGSRLRRLSDDLQYDHELATRLHERDRVHTYGSFAIAQLSAA